MTTQQFFELIRAHDVVSLTTALDEDRTRANWRHPDPEMYHWTALQYAASLGQLDTCRLLVSFGSEVYTNPWNTYPPVIQAAWNNHSDVVSYFLDEIPDKADGTGGIGVSMVLAAREGWMAQVAKHIATDPLSVYQRGWVGETALHWAAHNNELEIMTQLLDNGADIEADELYCYGGKPLHWASEHSIEAVALLLERGANIHSRVARLEANYFGMTPLHWNATQREDRADIAEMLLMAGADPAAKTPSGHAPIHVAREYGRPKIAALLSRYEIG